MSWAARRRFIILLIVGAIVVAFLAIVSIATFYQTQSCSDERQNQDEVGIDCGGPCPYLCTIEQQPPTVLFTKTIRNGTERIDVIASIENKNATAAAKNVPYSITLYGTDQTLIQQVSGVLDLPPGATVPVYVPGVTSGNQKIANAFLEIASSSPQWFKMATDSRIIPIVSNTTLGGSTAAPRITAILTNSSVTALSNVQAIVFVRDAQNDVIAASKTVVPTIPAQGQATATFTWNGAFSSQATSVQVVPIIPLP